LRYIAYKVKFKSFYNKYREMLFAYLMRRTGDYYLSSDIMQESFTRYLGSYGERSDSASLLFKIARNALLDDQRKRNRTITLEDDTEDKVGNLENHMMVRDEYRRVLLAMQQLGDEERDTLALVVSTDMSYRDIAEITGTSEQNVKVRVHRARVKLRKIMAHGDQA
jgi:RNA polymerase sigma-70 factor (ECF subfamily)